MTRPDPLTDELSEEDKQRLSIQFAAMSRHFTGHDGVVARLTGVRRGRNFWE